MTGRVRLVAGGVYELVAAYLTFAAAIVIWLFFKLLVVALYLIAVSILYVIVSPFLGLPQFGGSP